MAGRGSSAGGSVAAGTVVLFAAVVVVVELAAVQVASRAARDTVAGMGHAERVEVVGVARPASVYLVRRELRDVRVEIDGLTVGDLRVHSVELRVPRLPGVWGPASGDAMLVLGSAVLSEPDLERYLIASSPELAQPTLKVHPDALVVSDARVPFDLELAVAIEDGRVLLTPTLGDARLWSSLGLEFSYEIPAWLELEAVVLGDGEIAVEGRTELRFDVDGRLVGAWAAASWRGGGR